MTSRHLLIPKMRGSCSCIPSDSSTACSFDPNGVTTEVDCLSDLDKCFCSPWLVSNVRLAEWWIPFGFGWLWWFKLTLKGGPFRISSAAYTLQFSEKRDRRRETVSVLGGALRSPTSPSDRGNILWQFQERSKFFAIWCYITWCTSASVSLLDTAYTHTINMVEYVQMIQCLVSLYGS